jgi:hypothetical protein
VDASLQGGVKDRSGLNLLPHFTEDYTDDVSSAYKTQIDLLPQEFMLQSQKEYYEGAERYSRNHGFRIYNATRGGELEAFERVDFDAVLKGAK